MKNKYLIIVLLLGLAGMFTIQSCTKDETAPLIYKAAVPANPKPAVDGVVLKAGTSYTVTWEGTATYWDVYIGQTDPPTLAKAGVTGNSYTFTTTTGGQFYWYVYTKDANNMSSTSPVWRFFINSAPDAPVLTSPKADSVGFPVTGALEWTGSDPEGEDLTYDVYVGTSSTPGLVASGVADVTYSPVMVASTKYYWKVVANDAHGLSTSSVVSSFTTGLEAIMTYTGLYLADEPAEAYSYDVTFTKASSSTIETVNYWNSGWTAIFTLDLVNLTFEMTSYTFSAGWTGVESGILDPATGKMVGTYTLWKNGVIQEQGVHTYTKK